MTISYNWLSEYLPEVLDPEKLSKILTSIGLEVESLEKYERIKGGLAGLVIGEVLDCQQHPNADKLKLTTVNIGAAEPLQVVCGASNVAAGQKVVVATVGTTIYPLSGEPMTMKLAKIRGVESQGMICAEDEIGLGGSHDGIIVLGADAVPGTPWPRPPRPPDGARRRDRLVWWLRILRGSGRSCCPSHSSDWRCRCARPRRAW